MILVPWQAQQSKGSNGGGSYMSCGCVRVCACVCMCVCVFLCVWCGKPVEESLGVGLKLALGAVSPHDTHVGNQLHAEADNLRSRRADGHSACVCVRV